MVKLYTLVEIGYEYNDETYDRHGDGGEPVKVFRSKEKAEAVCKQMNEEKLRNAPLEDDDDEYHTEYFTVIETEFDEEDVDGWRIKAKEDKDGLFENFKTQAKKLFKQNEGLTSFSWTQYTPYFNDGDTCYFSVHADEPDINGQEGCDLDSGYTYKHQDNQYKKVKTGEPSLEYLLQPKVAAFLQKFEENDLFKMFGDHTKVTVNRDGTVENEDYSHD